MNSTEESDSLSSFLLDATMTLDWYDIILDFTWRDIKRSNSQTLYVVLCTWHDIKSYKNP